MVTIPAQDATGYLARLLAEASEGEQIVVYRNGEPVARIEPTRKCDVPRRKFGQWAGKVTFNDEELLEPLPEDIIDMMYHGPIFPDDKQEPRP